MATEYPCRFDTRHYMTILSLLFISKCQMSFQILGNSQMFFLITLNQGNTSIDVVESNNWCKSISISCA